MTRDCKLRRKHTVSEADQRASADALIDWLAGREVVNAELRAKQARQLLA